MANRTAGRRSRWALAPVAALTLGSLLASCSDDGGGGTAEELCSAVGDGSSYTAVFDGGFDPTDTERAIAQLQAARADLRQLHAAAPSEVRDDLEAEIDYLDAVLGVLQRTDPDDPAAVVKGVNDLRDERSAAQVAGLELRSYETSHCGTPSSDPAASSSTSTP